MYDENHKHSLLKFISYSLIFSLGIFYGGQILINTLFLFGYENLMSSTGFYSREILYNSIIREKNQSSIASIESLIQNPPEGKIHDIEEFKGDFLYTQSGSREEIIVLYEKALAGGNVTRLKEKISYLSGSSGKENSYTSTGVSDKEKIEYSSGEILDMESTRARIREDSGNRGEFLNILPEKDNSAILRDTIEFLNTDKERIDW